MGWSIGSGSREGKAAAGAERDEGASEQGREEQGSKRAGVRPHHSSSFSGGRPHGSSMFCRHRGAWSGSLAQPLLPLVQEQARAQHHAMQLHHTVDGSGTAAAAAAARQQQQRHRQRQQQRQQQQQQQRRQQQQQRQQRQQQQGRACRKVYFTRPMLSFSAIAWYAASVWCPIRLAYVSRLMFTFHWKTRREQRAGREGLHRCSHMLGRQGQGSRRRGAAVQQPLPTAAGETNAPQSPPHLEAVDVGVPCAHILGLQVLQLRVDVEAVAEGRHGCRLAPLQASGRQ